MNFRKGDKVKFLNDVGQGTIISFQNKDIAVVLNDDGFEVPVLMSELLKIEGQYRFNDEDTNKNTNQADANQQNDPQPQVEEEDDLEEDGLNTDSDAHIYFALVPSNQKDMLNSDMQAYLINDSNFRMLYSISTNESEFQSLFAYGNLEDNTKVNLGTLKRDELNEKNEFNFQLIFFRKGNYYLQDPLNKSWNIRPARFYKQNTFAENDFFHEKAFIYELTKSDVDFANRISDAAIEKAKKEKEPSSTKKKVKINTNQQIEEVDLHIQELVDDHSQLSNSEMLDIQMSRFTTALDGGIIAGTRRMVFIHGVGNGRLKHEIKKSLDRNYPKLKYQDASFKEYGYGATMVIIK